MRVMVTALESFRAQEEDDDRLSDLPKDILLLIISNLTRNEAVRFSLVSRRCEFVWQFVPVLIFEDSPAIKKIWDTYQSWRIVDEEGPRFLRRVNRVLEKHLGTTIDEFRITTDLDRNWQSHVDKWAAFAVDKQVKRLEFDFTSGWRRSLTLRNNVLVRIRDEPVALSPAFNGLKSCLSSFCLRYVNVTNDFVDYLSHWCPLLEKLCIEGSDCLTKISGSFQVKHLEVSLCPNLKEINISAKKLNSLILYSHPIELHVADASSLTEMSIGSKVILDRVDYTLASLSNYFSQLVFLSVRIPFDESYYSQGNWSIDNPVALPNLGHLELYIHARGSDSIEGWTSASIQKLTLKLTTNYSASRPIRQWVSFPLKYLKTLELVRYMGDPIDLELAFFVIENASMLEEVVVHLLRHYKGPTLEKKQRLARLLWKLPQHVKLIGEQCPEVCISPWERRHTKPSELYRET